jgi:MFS superfamily sulfate permease-like transporter
MTTNCRYLHRIASDCKLLIVPQGLSYAGIAGLPAIRGLYSDFAPLFMYVIFGTLIALIASDCVGWPLLGLVRLPRSVELSTVTLHSDSVHSVVCVCMRVCMCMCMRLCMRLCMLLTS